MIIKKDYPYPLMKRAEILKCMTFMNIPMTEQDITKPNPAQIQKIYESMLEIFKGIPREQFTRPNYEILDMLEYPDLHKNSLPLVSFYKTFAKFITELGVEGFGLMDLVQPEPASVVHVLSAIINFARFREDQLVLFEEKSQESDTLMERKRNLESTNAELKDRIQAIKDQRKEEEPAVEQASILNEKLKAELKELHRIQVLTSDGFESIKLKKTTLNDQLSNNQYVLMNLKQDCQKLKSRIVESPEKLVQTIENLNLSVSQEKLNVSSFERKNREIQMKIDSLGSVDAEVSECLNLMQDCKDSMDKYSESAKKLDVLKRKIAQGHMQLKELQVKEQQLNRQLIVSQEKITSSRSQNEARKTVMEDKLRALQDQYGIVSNELAKTKQRIDDNNKRMEVLKSKMQEKRRDHSIVVETVQESFEKMRDNVNEYIESVRAIFV